MNNLDILERVRSALEASGLSEAAASRKVDGKPDLIRNWRRNPNIIPRIDTLVALASALEVAPAWLAFGVDGDGPPEIADNGLPLVGLVSGGFWREVDAIRDDDPTPSPFRPDPRWPANAQFALRVEGESINRVARDGDLLAVVALEAVGRMPDDGALVIVEEARDGGSMIRTTAKRLHRRGELHELHADSDDPRWRDVRLVIEPGVDDGRPTVTRVTGLVTAVHRRLA